MLDGLAQEKDTRGYIAALPPADNRVAASRWLQQLTALGSAGHPVATAIRPIPCAHAGATVRRPVPGHVSTNSSP